MISSSALYLASVAATMLQADVVTQSPELPALCMKPTTGEWILVNPINPSGPALAYGTLPAEALTDDAALMPELPDNLKSWLQYVSDAQDYIALHPEAAVTEQQRLALAPAVGVNPIMPHIQWNQGTPYNNMIPGGSPTGCVATALSQIMYFYHYPEQGSGSHSYSWQGRTHSVNFAEETYNWDLMFDAYDRRKHSEEQIAEVAKLNYHVGVAMDMMYGPDASGAYDMRVNESMRDYFGYNPYGTLINRFSFGLATWSGIINRELQLGHPLYMSGSSNEGGHAFVVDGVSTDGYYHVNWGWGGAYNGWYDISIMHPAGVGTGASPSDDGFAWSQAIYAGFTPEVPADSIYYTTVQAYDLYAETVADTLTASIWLINTSATSQKGTVYIDLMKNGEMLDRQPIFSDDSYRYWRGMGGDIQYILPADLSDGDYQLRFSFCNREGLWASIYGYRPVPDYISLQVENGVKTAWVESMDVKMTAIGWETGELCAGKQQKIKTLVRNDGRESVAGLWYLVLTDQEGGRQEIEASDIVTIEPEHSAWIAFNATIEVMGECRAQLGVFRQGEDADHVWEVLASDTILQVKDDGTFSADLSLTAAPYLHDGDCEVNGTINIAAPLINSAEGYTGDLAVKIFSDKQFKTEIMSASTPVEIAGQEQTEVILPVLLSKVKAKRIYYASVFMRRGNKYVQLPGDGNMIKLNVKEEGHAAGIEQIEADHTQTVRRDLFGRELRGKGQQGFEIRNGKAIYNRSNND